MAWFGPLLEAQQDVSFDPSVVAHRFSDRANRRNTRSRAQFNSWQSISFQAPPAFDPAAFIHAFSSRTYRGGKKRYQPFYSWDSISSKVPAPPAFDPSVLSWLTPFSARTRHFKQYRREEKAWPETPFIPPPEPEPPVRRIVSDGKKRQKRRINRDRGAPRRNRTYELYESIRTDMQALLAEAHPTAFIAEAPRYGNADALLESIETLKPMASSEPDLAYRIQALQRQIMAYQEERARFEQAQREAMLADDDDFLMML